MPVAEWLLVHQATREAWDLDGQRRGPRPELKALP